MKRLVTAVAVALASTTAAAQTAGVAPSFQDYQTLSAEDLAPRAGALSAAEIRQHFPKGSFVGGSVALTPQDLAPRAGARSSAEILAEFPQPSFRDSAPVRAGSAVQVAASGN